jgi:hypothetical protein
MPGIGEEMEGAMQQAAQPERQFIGGLFPSPARLAANGPDAPTPAT